MVQANEADLAVRARDELPTLLQRQGRFRLLRELGRGAMGRVWEVRDLERGGLRLALKELKHVTPEGILLFKEEFRALRDIRHPNLVALDELSENEGFWYFTMECIDGLAFRDYVAGAPVHVDAAASSVHLPWSGRTLNEPWHEWRSAQTDPPVSPRLETEGAVNGDFSEERLRSALRQLAHGVSAVHRAGMIHRDLKPTNLLVGLDDRLVILDFGVAARASRTGDDGYIVGTAAYMAPEQARGKPPTPAADWYAVGVILFESLSGAPPFTGTLRELLDKKRSSDPPRPRHATRHIPDDLASLAQKLLHPDPERRPSTAEILEVLGARQSIELEGSPSLEEGGALFVGRRPELARLDELSGKLEPGAFVAVAVEGQSGVGKSSLVAKYLRVLDATSSVPVLVLQGRCHEREAVPYKAFDGVVDDLVRFLTGTGRPLLGATSGLSNPREFGALVRLFPAFGAVRGNVISALETTSSWGTAASVNSDETTRHVACTPSSATRSPAPDQAPSTSTRDASTEDTSSTGEANHDEQDARQHAFVLLVRLLRTIGASCRLVLAVDDIQWADDDSLALLETLTEQEFPGMLLLTARNTAEARRALASVRAPIERIELQGLSASETRELAAALRSDDTIDPAFVTRLMAESGGHPMFVEELVRHRGEEGGGEADHGHPEAFDLDTALRKRVATFSERAQRLLVTVAVGGSPVPHGAVATAAGLDAKVYRKELDALGHARLVRAGGTRNSDTVECYHDRVREAVYDALDDLSRRRYHAALAVALRDHGGVAPDVLAHHAERGGDRISAAAHSLVAAQAAEAMFAFRRAAEHYDATLRLGEYTRDERARLLEAKGQALQHAGIARQAARCYAEAARLRSGLAAIDLRRRSAEQLLMGGDVRNGKAEVNHVLAPFGKQLPRTEVGLLASLGWSILRVVTSKLRFQPRSEGQCSKDALVSIDMAWSVGAGLSMIDTVTGMQFSLEGFRNSLRVGEAFRIVRSACTSSVVFSALEWRRSSRRSEMICERASEMLGGERTRAYLEIARTASIFLLEQRWSTAEEHARAAVKAWKKAGMGRGFEFDFATLFATWCRAMRGELRSEQAEVDGLLREAHQAGNRFLEVSLRVFHHLPALADGRAGDVRADVEDAIRSWQDEPDAFALPHCWGLLSRRAALLYDGSFDEDELDRQLWRRVGRSVLWMVGYVRDQARAMQARWELAHAFDSEGRGLGTRAFLHRLRATALTRRLCRDPKPVTQAWGRLVAASLHASRHRDEHAKRELERAIRLLEASDSRLPLAVARWRYAALVRGDAGAQARRSAQAYIDAERIVAPEAMFRVIAPWPGE